MMNMLQKQALSPLKNACILLVVGDTCCTGSGSNASDHRHAAGGAASHSARGVPCLSMIFSRLPNGVVMTSYCFTTLVTLVIQSILLCRIGINVIINDFTECVFLRVGSQRNRSNDGNDRIHSSLRQRSSTPNTAWLPAVAWIAVGNVFAFIITPAVRGSAWNFFC